MMLIVDHVDLIFELVGGIYVSSMSNLGLSCVCRFEFLLS